jgi:hypothetical protein
MPLDLARFKVTRPYLFHLTSARNLDRIRETCVLEPAVALLRTTGGTGARLTPRRAHLLVRVGGTTVLIRDQRPLVGTPRDAQRLELRGAVAGNRRRPNRDP